MTRSSRLGQDPVVRTDGPARKVPAEAAQTTRGQPRGWEEAPDRDWDPDQQLDTRQGDKPGEHSASRLVMGEQGTREQRDHGGGGQVGALTPAS